ncbi:3-phosphoshikimate 1-carboxyvinyltransferase [Rossellomorea vietnamensis]|uniref:3-phosphoshikimate 1-carboxyvinyltransferase n=1 Tax=Rossellomorea vietnamensis TaxID=218284 RepID=A0A6I6USS8_9BACI|nr:3-phosphoshikimate 1-carboxyvinyltransferase [Rossellomorea vietnamensis]QHE61992.1 3-phosphoshikimate 1-carboxyvinyltransferase [Rossellomorea vietnamensis]
MEPKKRLSNPNIGLNGELHVPGDKSISHRSIMFGSVAEGKTVIHNFLMGEDCLSTISCFRKLGVEIEVSKDAVTVYGKGWDHLKEPSDILDVGNSGTTTRLIMGILSGRPFHSVLIGDPSIARRPMKRVTEPLKQFGTVIDGRSGGNFTPISIRGGNLKGIHYSLPVASAQVKSALILAGLQAEGMTEIVEREQTRNHTEKMIVEFGGTIEKHGDTIKVNGGQVLKGTEIYVPGDISSAAFFMVAAAIVPDSRVLLKNVGLNETRTGIVEVMKKMGASIEVMEQSNEGEPIGDILVQTSNLTGIEIAGDLIPSLIDEIPIIALLASQAEGKTVIKDAEELKVKETNRIDAVVKELGKLGANIQGTDDGMIIEGKTPLHGGEVHSWGDHRIGMTLAVASLLTDSDVYLEDAEAVKISYPTFFEHINQLLMK